MTYHAVGTPQFSMRAMTVTMKIIQAAANILDEAELELCDDKNSNFFLAGRDNFLVTCKGSHVMKQTYFYVVE